jgi:hypothetical protein
MRHEDKVIEVCGLVFNDFVRGNEKREHRLARKDVRDKATEYGWDVFKKDIPHSDSYFRAARDGMPIDRTKGAHGKVKDEFAAFAEEFFGKIGL